MSEENNILTDIPHILIKQRDEDKKDGEIMAGHNTEVFLNGKKLDSVTTINFGVGPGVLARVRIELLAGVEIDGNISPEFAKDPVAENGNSDGSE